MSASLAQSVQFQVKRRLSNLVWTGHGTHHGLIASAYSLPFFGRTSGRFFVRLHSECNRGQRIAAACLRFVGRRCLSGQQPGGKGAAAL